MTDRSVQASLSNFGRLRLFFCVGLCCLMITLVAASFLDYAVIRSFLDGRSGDGSADPYTAALHTKLTLILLAGGLLHGLMALVVAFLPSETVSRLISPIKFRKRTKSTIRWMCVACHQNVGWIVLMTLIAGILRWPYLNDPMRLIPICRRRRCPGTLASRFTTNRTTISFTRCSYIFRHHCLEMPNGQYGCQRLSQAFCLFHSHF